MLGIAPDDPNERNTARDCRVEGNCRNDFHGSKVDTHGPLAAVAKVIENPGYRMTLVTPALRPLRGGEAVPRFLPDR